MHRYLGLCRGLAFALVVGFALNGCSSAIDESKELEDLLKETLQIKDPFKAYQHLDYRFGEICKNNRCHTLERVVDVNRVRRRLITDAVNQKNEEAIRYLYVTSYQGDSDLADLKMEAIPKLIDFVDKDKAGAKNADLIMVVGRMYANGEVVMLDTRRAIGYFARAWGLGYTQAARAVAQTFLNSKDYRNAYLWSLRCIHPCTRPYQLELVDLQDKLTPEAVKQVQASARESSVIELREFDRP